MRVAKKAFLSAALAFTFVLLVAPVAHAVESYIWQTTAWADCSEPCGGGTQQRVIACWDEVHRTVVDESNCTEPRPAGSQACNEHPCPIDCEWTAWTSWSDCSVSCGDGTQTRERSVAQEALHGGAECAGPSEETQACSEEPCPVDCEVSAWTDWSTCSAPCGGGGKLRFRSVTQEPLYGGAPCPSLIDDAPCNGHPCPVDCEWSAWTAWGACSESCGGGTQSRERSIEQIALHGGAECTGASEETRVCNENPCPVDCEVSEWGPWTSCSEECGGGIQERTRTVTEPARYGGACFPLEEEKACNEDPCPVDCEVSDWSAWSECSETCGGGLKTHTRTVTQPELHGGAVCPVLDESVVCNDHICLCGNGVLDDDEACDWAAEPGDDAYQANCRGDCTYCGDGILDDAEDCDDANDIEGDGCSLTCEAELGWDCPEAGCSPTADDGMVVGDEECDDGNVDDGDGCYEGEVEDGWSCDEAEPSECVADELPSTCGDGVLDEGETCDDGNTNDGDGCSADCLAEDGYRCEGAGADSCVEEPDDTDVGADAGADAGSDMSGPDIGPDMGSGTEDDTGGDLTAADIELDAGSGSADVRSGESSSSDGDDGCSVAGGTVPKSLWWLVAMLVVIRRRPRPSLRDTSAKNLSLDLKSEQDRFNAEAF